MASNSSFPVTQLHLRSSRSIGLHRHFFFALFETRFRCGRPQLFKMNIQQTSRRDSPSQNGHEISDRRLALQLAAQEWPCEEHDRLLAEEMASDVNFAANTNILDWVDNNRNLTINRSCDQSSTNVFYNGGIININSSNTGTMSNNSESTPRQAASNADDAVGGMRDGSRRTMSLAAGDEHQRARGSVLPEQSLRQATSFGPDPPISSEIPRLTRSMGPPSTTPSLPGAPTSYRPVSPPPSCTSSTPPPRIQPRELPRSSHSSSRSIRTRIPSELAFTLRKLPSECQKAMNNFLYAPQARAQAEKKESRCMVQGCKHAHVHRTLQVQEQEIQDGRRGTRTKTQWMVKRVKSSFCNDHTCRVNGAGKGGYFCKHPKYPDERMCTCCIAKGAKE